jgi:hypothetical protein
MGPAGRVSVGGDVAVVWGEGRLGGAADGAGREAFRPGEGNLGVAAVP